MRALGLDLGTKTLGVSVSDSLMIVATGIKTIRFEEEKYSDSINELKQIIDEYKPSEIVIGLPKNMDNSLGFAATRTRNYEKLLKNNFGLPIYEQDERLTSITANNVLIKADVSRKKRKDKVDTIAATIILQNYLDRRKERQK